MHRLLERSGSSETRNINSGDLNLFLGLRINTGTSLSVNHEEGTKVWDSNLTSLLLQGILNGVHKSIDSLSGGFLTVTLDFLAVPGPE